MKKIAVFLAGILIGSTSVMAATSLYVDVPSNAWYASAVSRLSQKGVIKGYADNSFRPGQNVTRAELAVIMDRYATYLEHTAPIPPTADTATYTSSYGYSVQYPSTATLHEADSDDGSSCYASGGPCIILRGSDATFGEFDIWVNAADQIKTAQQCKDYVSSEDFQNSVATTRTINGITFDENTRGGVAAGTASDQTWDTTFHNNQCFMLERSIASPSDSSSTSESQSLSAQLDQVFSTFKFTK